METEQPPSTEETAGKSFHTIKKVFFLCIVILVLSFIFFFRDKKLNNPTTFEIKKGQSVRDIGRQLEQEGIISSGTLLTTLISILGQENKVKAGFYYFEEKNGLFEITKRITEGDYQVAPIKITFPEGFTVRQIGERLKATFPNFNIDTFNELTLNKEGYLFPNTYLFLPTVTETEVVDILTKQQNEILDKLLQNNPNKERLEKEIRIVASIVEKEVRNEEDMGLVAEIIYKRIALDMPLQMDSTLAYITGRDSLSLTVTDLKTDGAFNTYTRKGLPPAPIANPGEKALQASAQAEAKPKNLLTNYLFFLTDKEGKVYYARTFSEHVANKKKYLR